MAITKQQRLQAEKLIYDTLDKVDKSGTNTEYYKQLFASMTDAQFFTFFKRRLPLRYHTEVFKNEPSMQDIFDGFKVLDKPLLEKVKQPFIFKNKNGDPVESKECLVIYIHNKRMKQMLSKKTTVAIDTTKRDMNGRLMGDNKGGQESDREFEALSAMGLNFNMEEFARPKADAMYAKAQMNNEILSKGFVDEKDIDLSKQDSLAKNTLNVYLIGANIHSNLIDEDYLTPLTLKNKQRKIERR